MPLAGRHGLEGAGVRHRRGGKRSVFTRRLWDICYQGGQRKCCGRKVKVRTRSRWRRRVGQKAPMHVFPVASTRVNDWLLKINDVDLTNKDRKQVVKAVLSGGGLINMVVRRRKSLGGRLITPVHINLMGHKGIPSPCLRCKQIELSFTCRSCLTLRLSSRQRDRSGGWSLRHRHRPGQPSRQGGFSHRRGQTDRCEPSFNIHTHTLTHTFSFHSATARPPRVQDGAPFISVKLFTKRKRPKSL